MKFYREKSFLLGAMALLAPIPLPFNQVIGWASVIAFWGVTGLFLYRSSRGFGGVLPNWAMNLLGLAYLPFLFADLTVLRTGRVLQPLVHLVLFTMAVKLFAIRREKDKWHVFLGLFFVFIAAMGTSVHPSALLYLVAFGSLTTWVLVRFAGLHAVTTHLRTAREPGVPVRRFVTGTTLISFVAAIPLFFFLPRLRQPYVYAPAGGSGGIVQVSGFSDRLDLGMIDRVRSLRTVVFRFDYETPPPASTEQRFKSATYDRYENGSWHSQPRRAFSFSRGLDGFFHVNAEQLASWMRIWLRPGTNRMVLPVEAAAIDLVNNGVSLNDAGEARLLLPATGTISYRVGMAAEAVVSGRRRPRSRTSERAVEAVTPRMTQLAESVMGSRTEASVIERASRLERHLRNEYGYSLDVLNDAARPLESFLFETKKGHCEYFASSMVLLLRSQGIAARLVTGYLGADYNPLEGYHIVRQSNAHAWVEAFVPDSISASGEASDAGRWLQFDPTPPSARPQLGTPGWVTLVSQAYDYLLFRWDRYVLTYGFGDQVDVFVRLREAWLGFWQAIRTPDSKKDSVDSSSDVVEVKENDQDKNIRPKRDFSAVGRALPLFFLLITAAAWFWFRRESFSATQAYGALRARLEAPADEVLLDWLPPLEVERRLVRRCPAATEETRQVISFYLRESFAGETLSKSELETVKAALGEAKRKFRKAA